MIFNDGKITFLTTVIELDMTIMDIVYALLKKKKECHHSWRRKPASAM